MKLPPLPKEILRKVHNKYLEVSEARDNYDKLRKEWQQLLCDVYGYYPGETYIGHEEYLDE